MAENAHKAADAGGALRVELRVAEGLKFPSVKAQEAMLALADLGDVKGSTPDLFDPALDENERHYVFFLDTAFEPQELEDRLRVLFQADGELSSYSVQAPELPPGPPASSVSRAGPVQLRVDSRRLEEMGRLAGELVILKEQVSSVATQLGRLAKNSEISDLGKSLRRAVQGLHDVAGQIQDRAREFQQVSIGSLLQRFQRVARDTSRALSKKIECVIEGAETEVDGDLLDRLGDLLVHLVRNAADHGIESPEERKRIGKAESGRIRLEAYHEEDQLVIEVSDDGAGIDPRKIAARAVKLGLLDSESAQSMPSEEIVRFIFRAGFSTNEGVSEVSGRGVGLDVVKSRVEEMNGLLDLRSEPGQGTTFLIRVPLSLSIVQALLVEEREEIFAIPLASVLRVLRGHRRSIPESGLRSFDLASILGSATNGGSEGERERFLLELGYGVERYGLWVGRVLGRREIVIRPLGRIPGPVPGIVGAAALGDGRIVVVLDPRFLVERAVAERETAR